MPEWRDYERLVAQIYQELEPHARVVHNDMVYGHDTQTNRQIDVSVRTTLAGHELLLIVQAKDLSRAAGVNVVGEFKGVVEDVRAAKGVLICRSGFTKSALKYGCKCRIDLCSAVDARSRKWSIDLRIPLIWIEHRAEIRFAFSLRVDRPNERDLSIPTDVGKWKVSSDAGKTIGTISHLFSNLWSSRVLDQTHEITHEYIHREEGLRVLLGEDFWCPVDACRIHYTSHRVGWLGSFAFRDCKGILNRDTGMLRARVRIASTDVPFARDPSWRQLDDPDAFFDDHENMICIERSDMPPEGLSFSPEGVNLVLP